MNLAGGGTSIKFPIKNMENHHNFIPYLAQTYSESEQLARAKDYYHQMDKRRSLRVFSDQPVRKEVIETLLMTASTAPSGAHKQPWTFCAIANPALKKEIREAAEKEEALNYSGRMSDNWLQDLKPFGTDQHKAFLEIAPWLIVVMKRAYEVVDGEKNNNYYVTESVGLAAGFLLTAIHQVGLVALTHTPSPMNFLAKILDRPANERPFLLIPVGYSAQNATVPNLTRKTAEEVIAYFE